MPLPLTRARTGRVVAVLSTLLIAAAVAPPAHAHEDSSSDEPASGAETTSTTSTSTTVPSVPGVDDPLERQREIEQRIRELEDAIGEASAEEAALIRELSETQARLDEIDGELASIDAELATANARLAEAQQEVDRLQARYVGLTRRQREATRARDRVEDDVADLAAELYRRAGGNEAAAVTSLALDAETPGELFAGTRYLANAVQDGRREILELRSLEEQVASMRDLLEERRDEARAARDVVAREQAQIAALKARQEEARREASATIARQEQLVEEIHAKKHQFNARIEELRAESNRIAGFLRDRQGGQTLAPGGSGLLALPIAAPITSTFGQRRHPILGTTRLHAGVDLGAGHGTPVHASAAGEVVWAGPRGGYGNTVIIDHHNALATLYAHQSSVAVSVGQTVEQGQVVGAVGSTGLSTGPHLHWEVRERGTPVDPLRYL